MSAKLQIFYFLGIKTGTELMLDNLLITDFNKRSQAKAPNASLLLSFVLKG